MENKQTRVDFTKKISITDKLLTVMTRKEEKKERRKKGKKEKFVIPELKG